MPTRHSGFLIQGTFGRKGNFELVVPSPLGGLAHCWRSNDVDGLPWGGPVIFGSGEVLAASLIQSNFGTPGEENLEVAVRVDDRLEFYWREGGAPRRWFGPETVAGGVAGNPALIQSRRGRKGHFDVVVPAAGGGIAHYWRDNDDPELPWGGPAVFGAELGRFDAVALLQSNLGRRGNLEAIASLRFQSRRQLAHFWKPAGGGWQGPVPVPLPDGFEPAAGAVPAFLQSRFGDRGNFELVVPLAGGGMAHLARDNDLDARPWSSPTRFGSGEVEAVALLQSNFGRRSLGNFEVAARSDGRTATYWRADRPPFAWTQASWVCDEPRCRRRSQGEWRVPFSSGVVGVHAAVLRTGKVLFFSYKELQHRPGESEDDKHARSDHEHGNSSVLHPRTGALERPDIDKNPFCSGHAFLPDGRLLVAGGHVTGVGSLHLFTPAGDGGSWQDLGDMSDHRWYPTLTALPDGRIFILSGTKNRGGPQPVKPVNASYELFDPDSGLKPPRPAPFLNDVAPYSIYPFVFLLPSGELLVHANHESRFWNPETGFDDRVLKAVRRVPRTYPLQGSSVLLPLSPRTDPPYRARVMLVGGGGLPPAATTAATDSCEILDLGSSPLAWRPAAAMSVPRVMPDTVLLPDGTVLVVGGSRIGKADVAVDPVFETERYDPAADSWTPLCPMRVPRLYHSTALLLPDGRVLVAGKDEDFNPAPFNYPERRIEIYSPPYLFRGRRPRIAGAPDAVGYGSRFDVDTSGGPTVRSAALLRPGAVTHSFNQEQRYVELAVVSRAGGRVRLEAPPDGKVAPPGFYMLFVLDGRGVPSRARFLRLG